MHLLRLIVASLSLVLLTSNVAFASGDSQKGVPNQVPVTSPNEEERPTRGLPADVKDVAAAKNKNKFIEDNFVNLLRTYPAAVDMKSTERTFARVERGLYDKAKYSDNEYDFTLQLGVISLVTPEKRESITFNLVKPDGKEIVPTRISLAPESFWILQFHSYPLQQYLNAYINVVFGVEGNIDPSTYILRMYDGKEYVDIKLNGDWKDGKLNL
ncbi:hypothetical protein [Brevibacillus sp. MER 51]|uniref:hypothetical protein n=1 Tax=Brevibacillus sp. MER 51 TaxID=2939560 RepID=UPI002041F62C|nr:hypothetical protein [Brevibacillus sp. MER 51]MCM3141654.1 hypothetical protein [Brevibacillus sp. MER 51]